MVYRQARIMPWLGERCGHGCVQPRKEMQITEKIMNSLLGREGEEAGAKDHDLIYPK